MTPHFPIYMDYGATTPCDPRVVDAMVPWLHEHFGNPASRSHAWGWEAEEAVERARGQVAALVGADPREIVWTSGATESINLALKGAAHFYSTRGKHIVTVKTEHKAVLDTVRELERQGFEATYLEVQENGLLDLNRLEQALRKDTIIVSVMLVNNEIGVIQDIVAIGKMCRERGIIFHVDAAQATGKVDIDLAPAAGRPDEPGLAQDLRPQGHRRAVRAAQAARAHRGADARRRPRARHALGHAAHAPDRRHGRGLCHRQGRDGCRARAHPHAAAALAARAVRHRAGVRQRRPGAARAAQPERLLQLRRRRVADHGRQGHRRVVGLGLHLGQPGAQLRAARAGPQRRAGALQPAHDHRPLHHRSRDRLRGDARCRSRWPSCATCRRCGRCTRTASTSAPSNGRPTEAAH